jgi:AcrR family transcriptional regulator
MPTTEHQLLEARLLEAALRHIDAHGAEGLALRPLVAAAGTSTQAVYTRFGGRGGLMAAVLKRARQELEAELEVDAGRPGGITRVARALVSWQRRQPHRWDLLFGGSSAEPPRALAAAFAGAASRGEVGADRLQRALDATWSALVGVMMLARGGRFERAADADVVLDALLGGALRVEPRPQGLPGRGALS